MRKHVFGKDLPQGFVASRLKSLWNENWKSQILRLISIKANQLKIFCNANHLTTLVLYFEARASKYLTETYKCASDGKYNMKLSSFHVMRPASIKAGQDPAFLKIRL